MAGGKRSTYAAKAYIGPARGRFASAAYSPLSGILSTFSDGSTGDSYRVQTCTSLVVDAWTDLTNFTYVQPTLIVDPATNGVPTRFYRAVSP